MKKKLAVMVIAACVAVTTVTSGTGALNAEAAPQLKLASDSAEEVSAEEEADAEEETEESAEEEEDAEEEAEESAEEEEDAEEEAEESAEEEEDVEEEAEESAEEEEGEEEEAEESAEEEEDAEEEAEESAEEEEDAEEEAEESAEEEEDAEEETEESAEEEAEEFIPVGAAEGATITVSGTGSVTVAPDSASISIGVETVDESLKTAQSDNSSAVNAVIDALKAAGVGESSIRTSYYDLYSNYDYHGDTPELTGYTVSTMLTISGVDVDSVGDLIDAAVEAGANEVNGITYEYSDQEAAYDKALEAAVERAQDKAQLLAEKSGAVLGGVLAIIEEDYSYSTIDARVYTSATAEYESDSVSMNVLAGESTVTATVSVTFDLETPEEEIEEIGETDDTEEDREESGLTSEEESEQEDADETGETEEEAEEDKDGSENEDASDTAEVPYKEDDGDDGEDSGEDETPEEEE